MDMNIPTAELTVSNIDLEPINQAILIRAQNLAEQMSAEAGEQFIKDMSSLECSVSADGTMLSYSVSPSQSYLIEYLKSHGTPVSGGDNGTAHNVDGSTYTSKVPKRLQGTELPRFELPALDGEDEAKQLLKIMAPDATNDGIRKSKSAIGQAAAPYVKKEVNKILGGD